MAKAPIPRYCKTRMIPYLGASGAAALQQRLLMKTLQTALAANVGPVSLYCTPDSGHGLFHRLRSRYGVDLHRQIGRNLGQRMLNAARAQLALHSSCIILGTDCPAMQPANLQQAAAWLEQVDHVVQPAVDGGYVMLATSRLEPGIFQRIDWGGPRVMQQTRQRLAGRHQSWKELPELWDLDEWPDYRKVLKAGLLKR